MSLSAGDGLGSYEIDAQIGAGGMGEVYRAKDTRLGREVAIKVLPAAMTTDPDRVARFQREAKAVSALNHPNIVTLHEIGTSDAGPYLVLELVDGQSLRRMLATGPLPLRTVLTIAAGVAAGLAKTHNAGIVHRDLKPDNVMVTTDGFAKILDFGLARLVWPDDTTGEAETITDNTALGVILGTPGYLSPEQAAGKPADYRADQFALGALIYEMTTGTRPFKRATFLETLAATIRDEPEPLRSKRPDVPAPLVWVVERCLAKNPDDRYASTKDLARDLADLRNRMSEGSTLSGDQAAPAAALERSRPIRWVWPVAAAAMAIGGFGAAWWLKPIPVARVFHLELAPPTGSSFVVGRNIEGGLALAPNGRLLAFVGTTNGRSQLWIRRLDQSDAHPVPGTDGAQQPFWSPDSRHVAFYTPTRLLRVSVDGGPVQPIADVDPRTEGGAWMAGDVLLLTGSFERGIHRISAAGGKPTKLVDGDWPFPLPDGRRFLYAGTDGVWVGSLDPAETPVQIPGLPRSLAFFTAGHLLFVRDRTLMAQPFDDERLRTLGEPLPIAQSLVGADPAVQASISATADGVLVYASGARVTRLRWRNRNGTPLGEAGAPGENATPRIAPDGKRVAFARMDGLTSDLWIAEDGRASDLRLTFDTGSERHPVWSPDARTVTYASQSPGAFKLLRRPADGSGAAEELASESSIMHSMDWSSDGKHLAMTQNVAGFGTDLKILTVPGDGAPYLFLRTRVSEAHSQLSPGSPPRWLAYSSDEVGGRREVWVTAFVPGQPMTATKWQISTDGGTMPRWRGDGRELYYWALDGRMMAVEVDGTGAAFRWSPPIPLFTTHRPTLRTNDMEFDVTRDGQRFLLVEPAEQTTLQTLTVISHWPSALRR